MKSEVLWGNIIYMKKYRNYINGKWVDPLTDKWIGNINPATGELIGNYPGSGHEDINAATEAAKGACKEWRRRTGPGRAEYLMKAAEFLKRNIESFAKELCLEMGKPLNECIGDVQEAIDMAVFCAGEGRRNLGMVTSSEIPDRTVMAYRHPIGVAGAITPWNYPMAMPAWKVMPALITGNAVILKPAEDTPHSSVNFARAFEYACLPDGVFNLVMGSGEEAGEALVMQEGVGVISFTGSTEVGTKIAEKCPRLLKRTALEMGGKNAVVVLADADLELAVREITRAVFATSGQRCSSAGRIIVEDDVTEELTEKLVKAATGLKPGNGLDENSDLGPLINKKSVDKVHNQVSEALGSGATLLCGGERAENGILGNGFFYLPTLISSVTPEMKIAQDEVFGPVACIIRAGDADNALEIANDIDYGLTAAVFTQDINKAMYFAREIETGAFFINTACVGAEIQLPFGGFKGSGNGCREGAHHMLDIYTEWKSVSIQHGQ